MSGSAHPSRARLVLAFALIYVVWGSTYLAIRYAIETLPPMPMAGLRFLIAGTILCGFAFFNGAARPTFRDWSVASAIGGLYFLFGNGGVVLAEQWVSSGLSALVIATVPLWIAILDWVRPGGHRPRLPVILGLTIGFAGVALLIGQGGSSVGRVDPRGAAVLIVGSIAWAAGSLIARYTSLPKPSVLASGMQMLAGGAWLCLAGLFLGHWHAFDSRSISTRSIVAFAYLVIFGSLAAFTAYGWLVKAVRPAALATYAYVNPVVAVLLGWSIAGEALAPRTILAMSVILASVVMITSVRSDH